MTNNLKQYMFNVIWFLIGRWEIVYTKTTWKEKYLHAECFYHWRKSIDEFEWMFKLIEQYSSDMVATKYDYMFKFWNNIRLEIMDISVRYDKTWKTIWNIEDLKQYLEKYWIGKD